MIDAHTELQEWIELLRIDSPLTARTGARLINALRLQDAEEAAQYGINATSYWDTEMDFGKEYADKMHKGTPLSLTDYKSSIKQIK